MNDLREQFRKETGQDWQNSGTDGVHCVIITVPNQKYVEWLEDRLNKMNRFVHELFEEELDHIDERED